MKRLDKRVIWVWWLQGVGSSIVLFLFFLLLSPLAVAIQEDLSLYRFIKGVIIGGIIFVGIGVIWSFILALLRHHFFRYELTPENFKKEYGIIFKHLSSLQYERIQNIDIHRGILERLFGVSTLMIQTSGGSSFGLMYEAFLPGVSKEDAIIIREELLKKSSLKPVSSAAYQ